MGILLKLLLFTVGILLLYYGADYLVRGAANIARILGIKPIIVGLTVVAFGTSMPEFLVGLQAAIRGENDIAVGNIVGSNIANIALILGVSAVISPLVINYKSIKKELTFLLIGSLIFCVSIFRGTNLAIGLFFILIMIVFIAYLILHPGETPIKEELPESDNSIFKNIVFVILGGVGLVFGSRFLIDSAVFFARILKVPEIVIGMTIVAIGTSLPELAASVVASVKKESDISIGNIIGSNIFNMFFVIGGVSLIKNIEVNKLIYSFEIPVMLLLTVLLFPMIAKGNGLKRINGVIFLIIYIGFSFYLFWR
ncbi:MAG: calcium/sodium antiporter [Candidatus Marinimicrobia bacterium]|jgi:cation:H+ antiporter|nr:calcium/sodium antiporter [Candidatus Neomarinimicrobiota bacterium]